MATSRAPLHRSSATAPSPWPIGCLFLVVGPSGVGKDTLLEGARRSLTMDYAFARRTVTRPLSAGGEDHEPLTAGDFAQARAAGAFAVQWEAHGLAYGIRHSELEPLSRGTNVLVNASRRTIADFAAITDNAVVLLVTADPQRVLARLTARGREDAAAVAARMAREAAFESPLPVVEISNDTTVEAATARFIAAIEGKAVLPRRVVRSPVRLAGGPSCILNGLDPVVRARRLTASQRVELVARGASATVALALADDPSVVLPGEAAICAAAAQALGAGPGEPLLLRRPPRPASRDALRAKVRGEALSARQIGDLVRDLALGRYAPEEAAGFLVAASHHLSPGEVAALTRARAELAPRLRFDRPLVADKHSVGGVPGSRITPVVVAITVAHGLAVPKTSSRAITSAAGTADVMECVARVDLSAGELRDVVARVGGAIAWSGRICHTAIDDVMSAINRPLGIRSAGLDVSSILSKKLAAGATHVLIDIPVGPGAKVATQAEGGALADLFRTVGAEVGLVVETMVSDGRQPIGTGVGPALEMLDVAAVLSGDAGVDPALRHKALAVASRMIAWDEAVRPEDAEAIASERLASGAAAQAFEAIADAQGRNEERAAPGPFTLSLPAPRGGTVAAVDPFVLAGIARAAGAPQDKGAGVVLSARAGDTVSVGAPLAMVHASTPDALDAIDAAAPLYLVR